MPMRPEDEARLEQSKMSFGDHLEELRRALFKSIAALFIGFLFGLLFANDIVAYVQTPVRDSLQRFYQPIMAAPSSRPKRCKSRG
jgi:sec-independent protein translocase protein TatC